MLNTRGCVIYNICKRCVVKFCVIKSTCLLLLFCHTQWEIVLLDIFFLLLSMIVSELKLHVHLYYCIEKLSLTLYLAFFFTEISLKKDLQYTSSIEIGFAFQVFLADIFLRHLVRLWCAFNCINQAKPQIVTKTTTITISSNSVEQTITTTINKSTNIIYKVSALTNAPPTLTKQYKPQHLARPVARIPPAYSLLLFIMPPLQGQQKYCSGNSQRKLHCVTAKEKEPFNYLQGQ